tara:strand:+ start:3260 stop:3478 length:219 start_codon:yes stop_codon:yes gene_type:complete
MKITKKMKSKLGKALLAKLTMKRNAFGGNKGDMSTSQKDFPNAKPGMDSGYKAKTFGGKAGDRSKSRRDYAK